MGEPLLPPTKLPAIIQLILSFGGDDATRSQRIFIASSSTFEILPNLKAG